ncbi:hypothetical protein ACLBWA_20475, partial [Pseudomonas aeruginosa]
ALQSSGRIMKFLGESGIDEALHGSFLVLVAIRRREAAVGAVRGPGETGRYDRSGDYKTSS